MQPPRSHSVIVFAHTSLLLVSGMTVEMIPGKGPSFPEPLRELKDLKKLKTVKEANVKDSLKVNYIAPPPLFSSLIFFLLFLCLLIT